VRKQADINQTGYDITRIDYTRIPKIMLNYRPHGRRLIGRPLKTPVDETETGLSRPNS
jgi:hypothetical protein